MTERLYRHPTDRAIAGVAGGLAAWLNIDPSLVRIAWVLLAIFSGGIFVLVYFVMMIVVPLAPPGWTPRPRDGYGGGYGGYGGYGGPSGSSGDASTSWGQPPAPGDVTATPAGAAGWTEAPGGATGAPGTPGGWPPADGTPPPSWGAPPPGGWPSSQPWSPPKPGNAGIVVGVILIGLGIWFLVDQYVHINWDLLWPVVVMVIGGALIAGAMMRNRSG